MNVDDIIFSVKELEELFSSEFLEHSRFGLYIEPEGLFRARPVTISDNLDYIESIWYPDWSKIEESKWKTNRCSDRGEKLFYCSNSLEATIKEISPLDNTVILIGDFRILSDSPFRVALVGLENLKRNPSLEKELKNLNFKTARDIEIEKFISKKFKENKKSCDLNYDFTIALSHFLMKGDDLKGLLYPSVASDLKFYNYAIKPSFVDDFMYCENIWLYHISRNSEYYSLTPIMFGIYEKNINRHPKYWRIKWVETPREEKTIIKYCL